MTAEEWKSVPDFPAYEVSDQGHVRSNHRSQVRLLQGFVPDSGYRLVSVRNGERRHSTAVHRLVLAAFVGPCPEGMETRHLDGDPLNNRLDNLRYGTHAENMQDRIEHGNHPMVNRTHCKQSHEYTPENTYTRGGRRFCRQCKRDADTQRRERAAANRRRWDAERLALTA